MTRTGVIAFVAQSMESLDEAAQRATTEANAWLAGIENVRILYASTTSHTILFDGYPHESYALTLVYQCQDLGVA